MTKKIIQDVLFPGEHAKRSPEKHAPEPSRFPISREDITHGDRFSSAPPAQTQPVSSSDHEETDFLPKLIKKDSPPVEPPRGGGSPPPSANKSPRIVLWTAALLALLAAVAVTLSAFFSGATVKITPLNKTVVLNANLVARENSTDANFVPYQKITLPAEQKTETVTPTTEKTLSSKASGKIKIFNEYSSASQRLIKNTRFETASGKIYRIDSSIVVPGMTTSGGKKAPGMMEVTVYADVPGESYNGDLTDFSIPGFKGDPRYGKFYARSVTPLTGGFVGTIKVPSPEDIAAAEQKLKQDLKTELVAKARLQVPDGFVLYDHAMFVVFDDAMPAFSPQDPSHVTVSGSLYGAMFDRHALSMVIAQKTLKVYDGKPVLVRNLDDLQFTATSGISNPAEFGDIGFTLSGNALLVWNVDNEALKNDLAGVDKSDGFKKVVSSFPAIWKAEAVVRPFWKGNFPENPAKISIEEVLQ